LIVAAEDLLRHAVGAAEIAAVGDRDPQVPERALPLVDEGDPPHDPQPTASGRFSGLRSSGTAIPRCRSGPDPAGSATWTMESARERSRLRRRGGRPSPLPGTDCR